LNVINFVGISDKSNCKTGLAEFTKMVASTCRRHRPQVLVVIELQLEEIRPFLLQC
jgi:hypothetical protein